MLSLELPLFETPMLDSKDKARNRNWAFFVSSGIDLSGSLTFFFGKAGFSYLSRLNRNMPK